VAANKWRIEQARYLLRSIEVVVQISPYRQESTRVNLSIQGERGTDPGYNTITEITQSPSKMTMLVQQAEAELMSWLHRYNGLIELADACRGVRVILRKLGIRKKSVA
jgi:hypothetical protein